MSLSDEVGQAATRLPYAGTVADRLDVADAVTTFHRCADDGDEAGMRAVLAERVVTVRDGTEPRQRLRDEVVAELAEQAAAGPVQRLVAGHLVEVVGDTAVCTAQAIVVRVPTGGPPAASGEVLRIELVRAGPGWAIVRQESSQRWSWRGGDRSGPAEGVSS